MKRLIILLLLCSPLMADNDFSDAIAVFHFENGADLGEDSQGGASMTNNGVAQNTVTYKIGSGSADFEDSEIDFLYIGDGTLDADFPTRSTDVIGDMTICFWMRAESLPGSNFDYVITKWDLSNNKMSWAIAIYKDTFEYLTFFQGHTNGTDADYTTGRHATDINASIWYHASVTYDYSEDRVKIRIWDDNASAIHGTDLNVQFGQDMTITDSQFRMGNRQDQVVSLGYDGLLDEVVIWNRILSQSEVDAVRGGTYSPDTEPAATTYYVDTDDTTGPHDGSITNPWEDLKQALAYFAGASQDPISLNEAVTIMCSGSAADANVPIAPGEIETDSDNYLVIQGDKTGTTWNTGQYRIVGSNAMLLTLDTNDVNCVNLQFQLTAENASGQGCVTVTTPGTTNRVEFRNCIFRGDDIDDYDDIAVTAIDPDTNLVWTNSYVYDVNEGHDVHLGVDSITIDDYGIWQLTGLEIYLEAADAYSATGGASARLNGLLQ